MELARLEFQGSLYMGEDGPVLPGFVLEATIINGAKKSKDGPKAKAGMYIDQNPYLQYDGPKDRDGLWEDESFRFEALVNVSRAKIVRTRPIFNNWSIEFDVNYDDGQVNKNQVTKWIEDAGIQVGLCDWRPKYGRFEVEVV